MASSQKKVVESRFKKASESKGVLPNETSAQVVRTEINQSVNYLVMDPVCNNTH